MIRAFFLEFLLPLLLFLVVRAFLKNILAAVRPNRPQATAGRQPPSAQQPSVQPGGELKKDPVCGTYVAASASLTRTVNGEVLYFCSSECRDKYR